jgi:hypothetical protein
MMGVSLEQQVDEFMAERKKIIAAILMALAVMDGVYADMMPVSSLDGVSYAWVQACNQTVSQSPNSPSPFIGPAIVDLDFQSAAFWPTTDEEVDPTDETRQPPQLLEPGYSSFGLCLYTLMGLGLCKSAPWMKKLSLGGIPDWHYPGGLAPIGHTAGPDYLRSPAACFVQPDDRADALRPQHRIRTIVPSWRKSQFTPAVIASRGPPLS